MHFSVFPPETNDQTGRQHGEKCTRKVKPPFNLGYLLYMPYADSFLQSIYAYFHGWECFSPPQYPMLQAPKLTFQLTERDK